MGNPVLNITGLLWMEPNPKKDLAQIVKEISVAHERKLGTKPDLVLVHPSVIEEEVNLGNVAVRPAKNVLLRHYFAVRVEKEA